MATSGEKRGAFTGRSNFKARIAIALDTLDVANNRSKWDFSLRVDNDSGTTATWSGATTGYDISIGGQAFSGTTPADAFDFRDGADYHNIRLGTTDWIAHSTDGSKTIAISASIDSIGVFGSASASGSVVAPVIPRATQPAVSAASVDAGTAVTITTPRASSSFTHTLSYVFGADSGTIATDVATSQSWTPPLSLLSEIPDATSGTVTITCKTYNGVTLIGTKTVTLTLTAGSAIVPTISSITDSENVSAIASAIGGYVQGLSKLNLAITGAAGVYGSTITGYKLTLDSLTISAASGTTDVLPLSGTRTITATVTDSRGRTKTLTKNVTVLAYATPAVSSLTIDRCTSGGVIDPNGTYFKLTIAASVSSLIVSTQKNALKYRILARAKGGTTWTQYTALTTPGGLTFSSAVVTGGGAFLANTSYDVRLEITDALSTSAVERSVATSAIAMHWKKTGGVGVGKYHENGGMDVAGDIYTTGNVVADGHKQFNSKTIAALGSGVHYVRIASLNGVSTSGGASLILEAAGGTNYGNLTRFSADIRFVQRGDDGVACNVYYVDGTGLTFYTKQISTWVFELWVALASFNSGMTFTIMGSWAASGGTAALLCDSATTTAPSDLVAVTPRRVPHIASQAEVDAGTDNTTAVTPATLAAKAGLPFEMAAGSVTATVAAAGVTGITVTLPAGRFTQAPIAVASMGNAPANSAKDVPRVYASTTTALTVAVYTGDQTAPASHSAQINWIATQMTSGSAAG